MGMMYYLYGLSLLLVHLLTSTGNEVCPPKCQICDNSTRTCLQCQPGLWGEDCTKACKSRCRGSVTCNFLTYCANGCEEGWYGVTCDLKCAHCYPGGCSRDKGYCTNGCLPHACHKQCSCESNAYTDAERGRRRYQTMDSIPNNLIVAFVIAVVFIVFIVFVFCGYTKCPEKTGENCQGNNCPNTRTRRARARNSVLRGNFSGTRSSDISSYLSSNFPAAHRTSFRSNLTAVTTQPARRATRESVRGTGHENVRQNATIQDLGTTRRDVVLDLSLFPPPYGSLPPLNPPKEGKEKESPPPAYNSLFPPKYQDSS